MKIQPTLQQRYYRPDEAAKILDIDVEVIRQKYLEVGGAPLRLFFEIKSPAKVVWFPLNEDGEWRRKSELQGNDETGFVLWSFDEDKAISRSVDISAGVWLEIDHSHTRDMCANPDKDESLVWFRPPQRGLGPIEPGAMIMSFRGNPSARFADCSIAAEDVESLRNPQLPERAKNIRADRERNLLLVIRALMEDRIDTAKIYKLAAVLSAKLDGEGKTLSSDSIAKMIKKATGSDV